MTVSTYQSSDLEAQAKAVDGDIAVFSRLAGAFAPHAQATPDMTVALDAGHVFDGTTLSEVAAQTSAVIAAPSANPRVDRIVIDQLTGAVAVVTGTEAASPIAPAIASGKAPVARVLLSAGTAAITNDLITDERDLSALGRIIAVEAGTGLVGGGSSGVVTIGLDTPVAVANGGTGTATAAANTVFAGPASGNAAAPSFRALTLSDLPSDVATTEEVAAAVAVETARAEAAEALLAPLVSPALTGVPTAPTAAAGADTDQVATTAFVTDAISTAGFQHGQCYLTVSGGNLVLIRENGNKLIINGTVQVIPMAGVTLGAAGLTEGTVYYIYAYMNSGVMALEASVTGHVTDSVTGVEIKNGDVSRTLVGMACPQSGPIFVQSAAALAVLSWFNPRPRRCCTNGSYNPVISSASFAELSSSARAYCLKWNRQEWLSVYVSSSVTGEVGNIGSEVMINIGVDNSSPYITNIAATLPDGSSTPTVALHQSSYIGASEGEYHYFTPLGLVGQGTATFNYINVGTTVWG